MPQLQRLCGCKLLKLFCNSTHVRLHTPTHTYAHSRSTLSDVSYTCATSLTTGINIPCAARKANIIRAHITTISIHLVASAFCLFLWLFLLFLAMAVSWFLPASYINIIVGFACRVCLSSHIF